MAERRSGASARKAVGSAGLRAPHGPAVPRWAWGFVALYGACHGTEAVLVHTLGGQPLQLASRPVAVLLASLLACTLFTFLVRSICLGNRPAWVCALLWHNVLVATSLAALVAGSGLLEAVVTTVYGVVGGGLLLWYRPWLFAQSQLTAQQRPDLRPLLAALAAVVFLCSLFA